MTDQIPELKIFTLGPPEVRLGEQLVTFPTRKTLATLVYLAIEGGMQPREHLATLLWPESNPERSYANLRNTLGHLQKVLHQVRGQPQIAYLSITHKALGLNPEANIDLDLQTVEHAYTLARADRSSRSFPDGSASLPLLQSAAACQRGDFLSGFSLGDAPGFDDWVAIQREVSHRHLNLILDRLSEIQFARGEFAGVTETTSHWIALDALNEVAYRRKMRAHFSAGERGQALETYESCRAILAFELGIEPEPDTTALAERIRTQISPDRPHIHGSVPRPLHPDTSVAFLGNLFVGRTHEFQTLVNSFEQAVTGQPQLVVLRGEAGIGKTQLARKFLTYTSGRGAEILQGGAYESGSHLPLQPLVDALRVRIEHKNSPQSLLDEVWLSPLSQLIPELHKHYPDRPAQENKENGILGSDHSEIESNQAILFEPIVQYTLALARIAVLVVFIDDLQWADSVTLNLLHYAIRRWHDQATRVMLIINMRPEALLPMIQNLDISDPPSDQMNLSQWLTRVTRELILVDIKLEPLVEHEAIKLVQSILSPPVPDFAQWLYNETRGQPFYLIETLKDLLERRVLLSKRRAEGQWVFAVDTEHDLGQAVRVPSTVHAVIRSRLYRLSPNAFSMLASGAVLDKQITFERMCAISKVTEDLALPALDELISGRFLLETEQPGNVSTYPFVNDMLRDVVYTEAGDARRRIFHQRALEVLEAAHESTAVLAHHAQAAGLVKAAFRFSLIAGQEALYISAVSEAIIHFERARHFIQDGLLPKMAVEADLRDLYVQLGRAYRLSGQLEKVKVLIAERDSIS